MKNTLLKRFIKYTATHTTSNEKSASFPSTARQIDFGKKLEEELKNIGLSDVSLDKYGYVTATLPANTGKTIPTIGFIAHMDTSPDMSGKNVKAIVHKDYNGQDIILNKKENIILTTKDFPEIKNYKGQTIITTDGTTLLGADDKAGIAEIVCAMEYLIKHPEIKHGTIKIAFTPDEEIGKGADYFDVEKFAADFAYTIDGGEIGELEYENFHAAGVQLTISGRNIHPGYAKNKMVNAILVGAELNEMLPSYARPEHTDGYDGFFHLTNFEGTVEESTLNYIIRDFNKEKFEGKKQALQSIAEYLNKKYGKDTVQTLIKDQYANMREKIEPVYHIIETAEEAMKLLGIKPKIVPIRGGTDGAKLSYMGLPCPNIFAGGHNFHGRFEYIPLESMEKACLLILKIIELFTLKA